MASFQQDTTYDVVFEEQGPMGIDIESSEDGRDAYVTSSHHEKIEAGHMIVAVNNEPLNGLAFEEIFEKITTSSYPRTLSFSTKPRSAEEEISAKAHVPLPEDFFKDLPPLTPEEEEYIKKTMNEAMVEALKLMRGNEEETGLKFVKESSGVTIHKGTRDNSDVQLVRAKTQIPIGSKLFMNAALSPSNKDFKRLFHMLDPMFKDGQVLHQIPGDWTRYAGKEATAENLNLPFYSVKWAAYALPFPLWWRDFVWCELTCWAEDGTGVSMAMSIPRFTEKVPSLEESHGLVRGSIGLSGYFWKDVPGSDPDKPVGDNHMMIDITYLLQVDPKGAVPPWAVNLTAAQQGMNCLRVLEYAQHQREKVWFMYEQNKELNRTEVMSAIVDKGSAFETTVHVEKGQNLVYEWVLDANDIGFEIRGPDGEVLVNDRKECNMSSEAFYGRLEAPSSGEYTLKWDNSYSWFTAKTVFYHFLALN